MSWSYEKLDERVSEILALVLHGDPPRDAQRTLSRWLKAQIDEFTAEAMRVARGWRAQRKHETLPGVEDDEANEARCAEVLCALECARAKFGLSCGPEPSPGFYDRNRAWEKVVEALLAYDRAAGPVWASASETDQLLSTLRQALVAWRKAGGAA